ncbi:MAG: hypothetical protein HYY86_02825 [Candidatus Harrisonbacteria bacterium]|nr:hypothetical protein [Candidatus Harrisonbacteria bacterium]
MKNKALIYLNKCAPHKESLGLRKEKCLEYAKENGFDINPETDIYISECIADEECGDANIRTINQLQEMLSTEFVRRILIVYDQNSVTDDYLQNYITNFAKKGVVLRTAVKSPLTIKICEN